MESKDFNRVHQNPICRDVSEYVCMCTYVRMCVREREVELVARGVGLDFEQYKTSYSCNLISGSLFVVSIRLLIGNISFKKWFRFLNTLLSTLRTSNVWGFSYTNFSAPAWHPTIQL